LLGVITEPKQGRPVVLGPGALLNDAERWRKSPR